MNKWLKKISKIEDEELKKKTIKKFVIVYFSVFIPLLCISLIGVGVSIFYLIKAHAGQRIPSPKDIVPFTLGIPILFFIFVVSLSIVLKTARISKQFKKRSADIMLKRMPKYNSKVIPEDESGREKCSQCSDLLDLNAQFCSKCGANVSMNCPICKLKNKGNAHFCTRCGFKFDK